MIMRVNLVIRPPVNGSLVADGASGVPKNYETHQTLQLAGFLGLEVGAAAKRLLDVRWQVQGQERTSPCLIFMLSQGSLASFLTSLQGTCRAVG